VSRQEKALKRLLAKPTDFTWNEFRTVMESLGYELKTTGGSGRKFVKPSSVFLIHEPHPHKLLKSYQIRQVIQFLREEGEIE
jgi:predicted RNA binding protein YcfA (HicA-like mRNA interferase family)